MNTQPSFWAKIIPNRAIPLAAELRCLARRWRYGLRAPFRSVSRKRALVIAPHPDDETFGCGLLISLKVALGGPVRVVFLTSGDAVASGIGESKETVMAAREAQGLAACQHLGMSADDVKWLRLPDGRLPRFGQPGFAEAVELLRAEITLFSPGEVFCPHPQDFHTDHQAAAEMAREIKRQSQIRYQLIHYPLWIWYHASMGLGRRLTPQGSWRLQGGTVRLKKRAAISAYVDAPKARSGVPYCGILPWAMMWGFRHENELFFDDVTEVENPSQIQQDQGRLDSPLPVTFR